MPRLRRLADFYDVPIEQLLPRAVQPADGRSVSDYKKLAIDLVKLAAIDVPSFATLSRYLTMIQVQRGDFNGKVLTVRADDVRAIAVMLDVAMTMCAVILKNWASFLSQRRVVNAGNGGKSGLRRLRAYSVLSSSM